MDRLGGKFWHTAVKNPWVEALHYLKDRGKLDADGYNKAAASNRDAAQAAILKEMQGRDAKSMGDEIANRGGLLDQLRRPSMQDKLTDRDRAVLAQLQNATIDNDTAGAFGRLSPEEQAGLLEYMAARQIEQRLAPGPRELANRALGSIAELMGSDGPKGSIARNTAVGGAVAGGAAGATAGAQGIMALIDYLQGNQDEYV